MSHKEHPKQLEKKETKHRKLAKIESAYIKNKGRHKALHTKNKLKLANLIAEVRNKRLALNLKKSEIKRLKQHLNVPISENFNDSDVKKELAQIHHEQLSQNTWALRRLFMKEMVVEKDGKTQMEALKVHHEFEEGQSFHVNLNWHKGAKKGIGLPHLFRDNPEVDEVMLTQYGKDGRNGPAKRADNGKYYFINSDGSKGAYAAIYNTKIKILKIRKPKKTTAGKMIQGEYEPNLNPAPEDAQQLYMAKQLTVKDSLLGLFDKRGKHNMKGQCEGIMKYTFQKVISKVTGKYKHLYLRGAPLAKTTTALHRGKSLKNLRNSDLAGRDEADNPNKIQPGTVFFVGRNRPNLARFLKGRNRYKRAPVNKSSGRHWFVYMGEINGRKVFGDNHTGKKGFISLARMARFLPGRIIYNLHDPLSKYSDQIGVDSGGKLTGLA